MAATWIEEGILQLDLALKWEYCAIVLDELAQPAPGYLPAALRLRTDVIDVFLQPVWLPGVADFVHRLRQKSPEFRQRICGPGVARAIGQLFAQQWPQPQAGQRVQCGPADVEQAAQSLLEDCTRSVLKQTALEHAAPQVEVAVAVPPVEMVLHWLLQATAVSAWAALKRDLTACDENLALRAQIGRLRQDCRRLRADVAGRMKLLQLVRFLPGRTPGDVAFAADVADFLNHCARVFSLLDVDERESEVLGQMSFAARDRAVADVGQELALRPGWPPVALADLQTRVWALAAGDARLEHLLLRLLALFDSDPTLEEIVPKIRPEFLALEESEASRVLVVAALARCLDELERERPLADDVWKLAEAWAREFCRDCGGTLQLCRDPVAAAGFVSRTEGLPGTAVSRVLTTGLALYRTGKECLPLLDLVLEVPPPDSAAVVPLLQLAQAARGDAVRDNTLAQLCLDVASGLTGCGGVTSWIQAVDGEDRLDRQASLWRTLQRAALHAARMADLRGCVVQLFAACAAEGIVFVEPCHGAAGSAAGARPDCIRVETETAGPWFLVADSRPASSACEPEDPSHPPDWSLCLSTRHGLRFPDGCVVLPAVWVLLPPRRAEHPLVRCLQECEPLLVRLHVLAGTWPGWFRFNEIWQVACSDQDAMVSEGWPAIARAAFLALYDLAGAGPGSFSSQVSELAREVARRLYRLLADQASFFPRLDPQTLAALPLTAPPEQEVEVQWCDVPGRQFGEVLQIVQFGDDQQPARLKVAGNLPHEVTQWTTLPRPDFLGDTKQRANPLWGWWQKIRQLPWAWYAAESLPADVSVHQREFCEWLDTEPGQSWLDGFVHGVWEATEAASARSWYAVLTQTGWLEVYPRVDLERRRIFWPEQAPRDVPGVQWEFGTEDAGDALQAPVRFAARPKGARGKFSLGPCVPGSPVALALRLQETIAGSALLQTALAEPVSQLVAVSRAWVVTKRQPPDPQAVVLPILDALVAACAMDSQTDVQLADVAAALGLFRQWGRHLDCTVLPEDWDFSRCTEGNLGKGGGDGLAIVYHTSLPVGVVGVDQLGLQVATELVRPPRRVVSAGPAPSHYLAVRSMLESMSQDAPETAKRAAELLRLLDLWPAKSLEIELKSLLAHQFYPKCWELFEEEFLRHEPLFSQLEAALEGLVQGLGLTSFSPRHVKGWERAWLKTRNSEGSDQMVSGRVLAVIRPGLCEGQTMLLEAIVEVE
ncbi:MAG: hypothetical protein NTY19_17500 [Planctomycetota bacterium]|nr:hypothetical protein [Planctomycetota bacterium]